MKKFFLVLLTFIFMAQKAIAEYKPACSIYDLDCPKVPQKQPDPPKPQIRKEPELTKKNNYQQHVVQPSQINRNSAQNGFSGSSSSGKAEYHQAPKQQIKPALAFIPPPVDSAVKGLNGVALKVKVDNHAGTRYQCISEVQEKIVKSFVDWLDHKGKIGYADPAANHNIEDQISWASSKKLFERFGKGAVFSCGASDVKNFMPSCTDLKEKIIAELGGGKGVLYFNPFGSWGSANRKMHLNRLHLLSIATEAGIPFVSGPQLMHYDSGASGTSNFHVLNHFLLIYICKLHWNWPQSTSWRMTTSCGSTGRRKTC